MLGRMQWQKSSVETKHFVTAGFKLLKKQIYTFVSICFPLQPLFSEWIEKYTFHG